MTTALQISALGTGFLLFAFFAFAFPASTHAADYAYVNNAGYVQSISAVNASAALMNATNISMHSGVFQLISARDHAVVGTFIVSTVITN